jgi:hypothetical protein
MPKPRPKIVSRSDGMIWRGNVFPDAGEVELYGDVDVRCALFQTDLHPIVITHLLNLLNEALWLNAKIANVSFPSPTIQEIYEQLVAMNPNYDRDSQASELQAVHDPSHDEYGSRLTKRKKYWKDFTDYVEHSTNCSVMATGDSNTSYVCFSLERTETLYLQKFKLIMISHPSIIPSAFARSKGGVAPQQASVGGWLARILQGHMSARYEYPWSQHATLTLTSYPDV